VRIVALACLLLLLLPACGRERPSAAPPPANTDEDPLGGFEEEELTGRIQIDGSSTVAPLMTLAAERFRKQEPKVRVSVGVSGTGGGFERFCRGETDLSNASRKIKDEEKQLCANNQISFFAIQVANDGISLVANKDNTWAECLTVDQLRKIWEPKSKVKSWKDVDPSFPDEKLSLFGPGTDSGTFDYFTDAIVGEEGSSRSDYTQSEDDNVSVQGVAGAKGALGYFGLSYFIENVSRLKALAVDGGDGCVKPTLETVQDGSYKPLSRPLFVYINEDSLADKPALDPFLTFLIDTEPSLARKAKFVPMTQQQLDQARTALESGGVGVEQ
jgi:phosphate transport system substrate-binding protein